MCRLGQLGREVSARVLDIYVDVVKNDEEEPRTDVQAMRSETKNAHLCASIPQIIHRDNLPSTRLIQVLEERADDRPPQMPNLERLGCVRRRVLDDDFLALAGVIRAVLQLPQWRVAREGINLGEHIPDHTLRTTHGF
ncbi:hypothetical protein CVT25_006795 [Psilocybe cyanescens]|uniref:Uncharacterized protein n=1 Tax=Psilocybe cyanescens TaxID=93625 RepID=A0A409WYI8_PSICY|nr:hypothetical protein CVT25_006795 [Psilocybe cyanescens]